MKIQTCNPPQLGKPGGHYSLATRVRASELLFVAGNAATDIDGKVVGAGDFDAQCDLVYKKIGMVLEAEGATFANVVQFTTYLVDSQDVARFMEYRARAFPRLFEHGAYPPNTLIIVKELYKSDLRIVVATVAAL